MSESQLSFSPVTQDQVTSLQATLQQSGFIVEPAGNTFTAKHQVPDIEATAGYIAEQQTLLVTITHDPFYVPVSSIETWIETALGQSQNGGQGK
jgi:hypothetical protein